MLSFCGLCALPFRSSDTWWACHVCALCLRFSDFEMPLMWQFSVCNREKVGASSTHLRRPTTEISLCDAPSVVFHPTTDRSVDDRHFLPMSHLCTTCGSLKSGLTGFTVSSLWCPRCACPPLFQHHQRPQHSGYLQCLRNVGL